MHRGAFAIIAIAGLLVATALSISLGDQDHGACEPRCIGSSGLSPDAPGAQANATESTSVENTFVVPANAAAGGIALTREDWRAFRSPPENTTGALVEVQYTTTTPATGYGTLDVLVGGLGDTYNASWVAPDGKSLALRVTPEMWSTGNLWISIQPHDDPGIVAAGEVSVRVTAFTDGPPLWHEPASPA